MKNKNEVEESIENTDEDNIVKIANSRLEVYNQTILNKLQRHDQIVIKVLDTYLARADYIINQWAALGIMPVKGKLVYDRKEEEIKRRDGKSFVTTVNTIILTKQPELFKFTRT